MKRFDLAWSVRHPVPTLLVAIAVGVAATFATLRIHPDASLASMTASDAPAAAALAVLAEEFTASDELLLVVSATSPQHDAGDLVAFARRFDEAVRESARLRDLVASVRYESSGRIERAFFEEVVAPNGLYYLTDEEFRALRERLAPEGIRAQLARAERLIAAPGPAGDAAAGSIARDPLFLHEVLADRVSVGEFNSPESDARYLFSRDGRSILIRVRGTRPVGDLEFSRALVQAVAAEADAANAAGLKIETTGAYAIAATAERAIRRDMIVSVVGSVTLILGLFLAVFRRPLMLPLLAIPAGLGILLGFGLFSLASTSLTPMTAVVGAVVAGLGVDFGIHFLAHLVRERATGRDVAAAATAAGRDVVRPMTLAAATSIVAFAALAFSSVPAVRDFGVVGALGLAGALVATLFLLPALCVLLPSATAPTRSTRVGRDVARGFVERVIARGRACLVASGLLGAVAIAMLVPLGDRPVVPIHSDPHDLHPQPNAPLALQEELPRRFGAAGETWPVLIEAATDQELLVRAHEAKRRLESLSNPAVRGTAGVASLLPDPRTTARRGDAIQTIDVHEVLRALDGALHESIFEPAAFGEYRESLRRLLTPGPPPGLDALSNHPELASRLLSVTRGGNADASAAVRRTILLLEWASPPDAPVERDRAIAAARAALAPIDGATLTGVTVVGRETERSIRRTLSTVLPLALALIVTFLAIVLRRPGDVLLVLLPAVAGVLAVLVLVRVGGLSLNLINVIGLPLLLGLGIDDGIFLVLARRHSEGATAESIAPSVRAIVLTSATTALGFGSLAFTAVPAVRALGLLTAVGIAGCLFATLFALLPIVMKPGRIER